MSVHWRDINPVLVTLFSALATPSSSEPQVPPFKASWRDRPLNAVPVKGPMKGVMLLLRTTSVVGIGEDDRRLEYIEPDAVPASPFNDALKETMYGLRRVTINVEAQHSVVADGYDSLSTLERIQARMSRRRVIDYLLEHNIAIVDCLVARALPVKAELHIQSRAQMDVVFTMVSSDVDPVPTGWIETLSISSRIEDTDGTVLPVPPNFNNLIVDLT